MAGMSKRQNILIKLLEKYSGKKVIFEEEDDLFKPRRVDDRFDKLSSLQKKMSLIQRGDKLDIYLPEANYETNGYCLDQPEEVDDDDYEVECEVGIPSDMVEVNRRYGIYETTCKWNKEENRWEKKWPGFNQSRWVKSRIKNRNDE